MIEDDDLPVLVHVLRTAASPAVSVNATLDESLDDAFDPRSFGESPLARPIVIGHEVGGVPEDEVDPAHFDGTDPTERDIVAHPPETTGHDAFVLARDAAPQMFGPITLIDEPEMVMPRVDPSPAVRGLDVPLDFSSSFDPAVLAARVRAAVMDDLAVRIDTELDARIAQVLHAEVETALAQLQHRLRTQLADALRDVVARAVDQEIARSAGPGTRPH